VRYFSSRLGEGALTSFFLCRTSINIDHRHRSASISYPRSAEAIARRGRGRTPIRQAFDLSTADPAPATLALAVAAETRSARRILASSARITGNILAILIIHQPAHPH
jgi:hypothetical protein